MSRPNINQLFSAGTLKSGNRNAKQNLLFRSLQWRQAFQTSERYVYQFEDTQVPAVEVRQILNGEMKGLGTGTFVWPAAHILAKYVEMTYSNGDLVAKLVVDVGTGTGLTGLIASHLGAEVLLTDQECVLDLIRENCTKFKDSRGGLASGNISIAEYDWNEKQLATDKPIDLVIVSDCVLPKLYPISLLVSAVAPLIGEQTLALFSYEHRPFPEYDPRQEFQRQCKMHGLLVRVVPLEKHHEVYRAEDIEIWEVSRADAMVMPALSRVQSKSTLQLKQWGERYPSIEVSIQHPVSLEELDLEIHQSGGASGIGGVLWPSSILCGRLLLASDTAQRWRVEGGNDVDGKNIVLDIGAGCGLTSIIANFIGENVIATDRAAMIDSVLNLNIQSYHDKHTSCTALTSRELDWELDPEPASFLEENDRVRLVICSDCLYSSLAVQPLLSLLDRLVLHERDRRIRVNNESAQGGQVNVTVLLVNEQRTALEEFLAFAIRRPVFDEVQIDVQCEEIVLNASDLVLLRSAEAFHVSPPLRACWLRWSCLV